MREGIERGVHGGLDVIFAGLLMHAHHFGRLGWIDGLILSEVLMRLPPMIRSYSRPSLAAHFFDRGAHLAHVLFFGEIDERFILERTFVQADLHARRGFHGCHRRFPFEDRYGC